MPAIDRWATFDCYGTLVDWNAGIGAELARLFGDGQRERLLRRYHEIEPRVQRDHPQARYRTVMAMVLAELAAQEGVRLPDEERDALGRSLPRWPVFDEVPAALHEAHDRGWRLVALTNSDRDLIDASVASGPRPATDGWEMFGRELIARRYRKASTPDRADLITNEGRDHLDDVASQNRPFPVSTILPV